MKLTNYYRGYQPWCDCVIHGTIYLSKKDFEATLYKEFDNGYTDIHPNKRTACLGVTATRKLFGHLPKFKRANYRITMTTYQTPKGYHKLTKLDLINKVTNTIRK